MRWTRTSIAVTSVLLGAFAMAAFRSTSGGLSYNHRTITVGTSYSANVSGLVGKDGSVFTEFLPFWYVQHGLDSLGYTVSWDGPTKTLNIKTPAGVTPNLSKSQSTGGPTKIELNGTVVQTAPSPWVAKDPASGVVTSFLPIWYIDQALQRIGFTDTYDGIAGVWRINPASDSMGQVLIYAWANNSAAIYDSMAHSSINGICNDNYVFNSNGNITDGTMGLNTVFNLTTYGQSNNVNVFATVSNWDSQIGNFSATLASTVLNSSSLRATLEQNLVDLAIKDNYTGIDLDIEQVHSSDQLVFTDLVDELSTQLHAVDKQLSVTIPGDAGESYYSGYNLDAIGLASDLVPVMTYEYNWAGSKTAGPIAPLTWDERVLKYVTSHIPANKVLLGIGTYGYDWITGSNNYAKSLTLTQIDTLIQNDNLPPSWDSTDSVPFLKYTDSNHVAHTIYYENQISIQDKFTVAKEYGVAGIAFWKAGSEDAAFWNAINQEK